MANDVYFLYFLLLPSHGPGLQLSAVVQVMLSPREINKNVIDLMTKQTNIGSNSLELNLADFNSDIHVLQGEAFVNLLKLLQEHKKNTAKEIDDHTKGLCKTEAEKVHQDIMDVAFEVQDKIFKLAFQGQPTLKEYMQQGKIHCLANSLQWVSESSLDYGKFPEKMALQAKVVKKTELKSYPSLDSLHSSSPIPLEEVEKKRYTTDFVITDVLRMFNKDGTPIAPPFTPEKVEGRNLCRVDSTPDLNTQWPNSQSLQYHDIYYYMDENDLGLEKKYSKIRDKVLEQDTLSTFVSPIKKKPQRLQRVSPIRSSPRRQNSAQHLMTRSRSDSVQSVSPAVPHQPAGKDVFKQPSLSLHSSLPRCLITPGSNSSSKSQSSGRAAASSRHGLTSQPMSHSTPLSSLPLRISPRKKVLSRSFSSAYMKTSPAATVSKNDIIKQASQKKQVTPLLSQRTLHRSLSEAHSLKAISPPDPPVRRSPRKSAGAVLDSSKNTGVFP
ncbi:hypothetical protein ElyMa_004106500 [Elysia marginata]|uniref:Uncharacterized protein n=1 Tax=Elysia marginata TaxID=1093978 RepID=A0AAV4GAV4_9GAST|nr:hypothetical protein ElyMa_004106500 [Elysia marginata]